MEKQPQSHNDECPHCRVLLEIVSVKIGLAGVTMQSICPNCGMMQPENPDKTSLPTRRKRGPMSFLRKPRLRKPR
jgi:hypothetical protein